MRRHISLKSSTCKESVAVESAGISVKVGAHYPARAELSMAQERCIKLHGKERELQSEG
jgi:hypothetical protein